MRIYIDGSKRDAVSRMFPIWEALGHKVLLNSPALADVQLSVARTSNKSGLPTVLRLDGVYYDSAINYKAKNASISKSHKHANAVIYQSECSKKMAEVFLKPTRARVRAVIHNGIDPIGWDAPIAHNGINVFACAKWRRPKRLEELLEIWSNFLMEHPSAKLHIVGGFKKGGKEIQFQNVYYRGQVNHSQMRSLYSLGDMFIHLCKKDSCPSSVVEAIAAGMPVITTNACGGATEMCKLTDGCVIVGGEKEEYRADFIYQDKAQAMPSKAKDHIVSAMKQISINKPRVVLPEALHIETIAKQYLEVFEQVM